MIKTSKKAARTLGIDLAVALHAQRTVEARGGVLDAQSVILAQFDFLLQGEFLDGFNAALDRLEPLSSPRRGKLQ